MDSPFPIRVFRAAISQVKGNESPDYKAFEAVGQAMQQAGGHQAAGIRGPGATRPQDPEWFWTLGHNSELQSPSLFLARRKLSSNIQ